MRFSVSKRGIYWGLGILILYGLFLLIKFPAGVAYEFGVAGTPLSRSFVFDKLEGTIWNATVQNLRVNRVLLGRLRWNLNPLSLLLGGISSEVDFRSTDGFGTGNLEIGMGGSLQIENARVSLPVESLAPLMYGVPVKPEGDLNLNIESLRRVPAERLNIEGKVTWTGAAIQFRDKVNLGDLSAVFSPVDNGSRGILSDAGGPLSVEGSLQIDADGKYQLRMKLAARDRNNRQLADSLSLLGRADRQGKVNINYNGFLRF